jgi:hypothetical protein
MERTDTFAIMSRSRRTTTALLTLTLIAAACSSSSNGTGELSTTAPTPPPATTGDAEPPPVTDATTTTTTTTTATTTTSVAPTTSIDEAATLIAEIEADLNEGEQAFLAAAAQPGLDESRTLVERHFAGEALQRVLASLAALAEDGLVVRPNDAVESAIVVLEITESAGESATVSLCRIDAAVVVVAASDVTPEIIVNDIVRRSITMSNLQTIDGVWAVFGSETTDETEGATTCDDA